MALDLVPTDALIEELQKRHCQCVFIGRREVTALHYTVIGRHKGDWYTLIGMCHQEIDILLSEIHKSQHPMATEDT